MLVLFETPAGYALFKLTDDKLASADDDAVAAAFATPEAAVRAVKLRAFHKFHDTVDALAACTALVEGKLGKNLRKFLEESVSEKDWKREGISVGDAKLGQAIAKKFAGADVRGDAASTL